MPFKFALIVSVHLIGFNYICWVDIQVRYDLIQPELRAFADIRQSNSKLSIFNLTGRLRNSLATTKIVLSILDKCNGDKYPADTNSEQQDQTTQPPPATISRAPSVNAMNESSLEVNETGTTEEACSDALAQSANDNEKQRRTAISTMISVVEAAERRLEHSWF